MTPPPAATAVADLIRPRKAPVDSRINRDILAATKGASWPYFTLLALAVLGVLQAVGTLLYQTYYGLGVAGYQAPALTSLVRRPGMPSR